MTTPQEPTSVEPTEPISKGRVMWSAFSRVFIATAAPLLADALLHTLNVIQGDPAFADAWWVTLLAPTVAAALRYFVPQPVDRAGVGVVSKDERQHKSG